MDKAPAMASAPDFGLPELAPPLIELRARLNQALLKASTALPPSLHLDAGLLLYELAGSPPGQPLGFDFFRRYYPPAYSILHWMRGRGRDDTPLPASDPLASLAIAPPGFAAAVRGHACAMFLHLFDDHLIDGALPLRPLGLQLRTCVYGQMEAAFEECRAAASDAEQAELAEIQAGHLNRYFRAVQNPFRADPAARPTSADVDPGSDLDGYCEHFRDEMATWWIAPEILARLWRLAPDRTADLRLLYEDFGIAWRLLDDLQDVLSDARAGVQKSAVYWLLPANDRPLWLASAQDPSGLPAAMPALIGALNRADAGEILLRQIRRRLESARLRALNQGWDQLAAELAALGRPLGRRKVRLDADAGYCLI